MRDLKFSITKAQAVAFWGAVNDEVPVGTADGMEVSYPKAREAQSLIDSIWPRPRPSAWNLQNYTRDSDVARFFRALADALDEDNKQEKQSEC